MMGATLYFLQANLAGVPLQTLYTQGCQLLAEMRAHKQEGTRALLTPAVQAVCNLLGKSKDTCVLTGEFMNEDEFLQNASEAKNSTLFIGAYVRILMLAYYMNNFDLAADAAKKSRPVGKKIISSSTATLQVFFDGLTALELARTSHQRLHLKRARLCIQKMKDWVKHSAHNLTHKLYLLEAEMAFLKNDHDTALMKYKDSIDVASNQGFVPDHALACERAGVALRHFGHEAEALSYLTKALHLYGEWGAVVKVDQLEQMIGSIGSASRSEPPAESH